MYKYYLILFSSSLFHSNLVHGALEISNGDTLNDCTILKDNFANTISEFTQCSITYSRPITLCKSCVNVYIDILDSYKNMSEVSLNGTKCLNYYINQDRLQILQAQYSNAVNLWNQAKCYECYIVENNTQTCIESEVATQFRRYYDNFNTCTQTTDAQTLCRECMDDYVILSNFYGTISNTNERIGVCIDLEDLMNSTWTFWGLNCCKYRRHNEYIFIGSTICVFVATILLYVIVQFCGEKKAPTIIQQSRFAESVNRF